MRVFVTRSLPGGALDRLSAHHDVTVWEELSPPSSEDLLQRSAHAHALITMLSDRVDEALFDGAPNLRAVANYAVGFENIAVDAATRRGIAVGNTPDVLTDATAQFALALTLNLLRRVSESANSVRSGRWQAWAPQGFLGRDLEDTVVGVVGWGRIGRAYAQLAGALGLKVVHTGEQSLNEVLAESDLISLHVPLTPATTGLIGAQNLSTLQRGALIVNTSRGAVVDTRALLEALERGHIGGVALDVTDPEPLPADHPLMAFENVIVTPHIASASMRSRVGMAERAVDNVLAALEGNPMPYPVNFQAAGNAGLDV